MNAQAAEYLGGDQDEPKGKPAPKFGIHAATDPDSLAIMRAREAALNDEELGSSEIAFVVFALDRASQYKFYQDYKKGITCVADSIVAKIFHVTTRTVYNWRHAPKVRSYVWFSKVKRPDKWAMMLYHLTCLHPAPDEKPEWKDHNGGGAYAGGAKERPAEPDPDAAARGRAARNAKLATKRAQQTLPLTGGFAVVTGNFPAKTWTETTVLQGFSADSQNIFRPTAEKDFGGQPKNFSADSRKTFRRTAEKDFGPGPKKISAAGRKKLPPTAEKDCHYKETEQEQVAIPDPKRVETRAKAVENDTPRRRAGSRVVVTAGEREFMALCLEIFGEAEVNGPLPDKPKGNGGLWRLIYREYAAKASACVLETKLMKNTNPGILQPGSSWPAYCMDLWKADHLNYGKAPKRATAGAQATRKAPRPPGQPPAPLPPPLPTEALPAVVQGGLKAARAAVEAATP